MRDRRQWIGEKPSWPERFLRWFIGWKAVEVNGVWWWRRGGEE